MVERYAVVQKVAVTLCRGHKIQNDNDAYTFTINSNDCSLKLIRANSRTKNSFKILEGHKRVLKYFLKMTKSILDYHLFSL